MINQIKKMIAKNQEFINWNEYKKHIDFLETFQWQQNCRKQHLPKEDKED